MLLDKTIDSHNRTYYRKVYRQIIKRARSRGLNRDLIPFYVEIHHILPRCLGGSDNNYNKVSLTYKEHYICHLILKRLFPSNYWIHSSFYLMSHIEVDISGKKIKKKINSKLVDEFKEFSKIYRKPINEETRKRMSESHKGKKMSKETREKLSKSLKGKKHNISEEGRKKLIENNKSRKGKIKPTKETLKKLSKSLKEHYKRVGGHRSLETREKISRSQKGRKKSKESIKKAKEARLSRGGWAVSEETREKMRKSKLGKNYISDEKSLEMSNRYGFAVEYIDENNNKYIFSSMTSAVKELKELGIMNVSIKYIKKHCSSETNGFRFIGNNKMIVRSVIDSTNGIEYSSLSECARALNISRATLLDWINKYPEKGFFYKTN